MIILNMIHRNCFNKRFNSELSSIWFLWLCYSLCVQFSSESNSWIIMDGRINFNSAFMPVLELITRSLFWFQNHFLVMIPICKIIENWHFQKRNHPHPSADMWQQRSLARKWAKTKLEVWFITCNFHEKAFCQNDTSYLRTSFAFPIGLPFRLLAGISQARLGKKRERRAQVIELT